MFEKDLRRPAPTQCLPAPAKAVGGLDKAQRFSSSLQSAANAEESSRLPDLDIAVLLPCFNEGLTIGDVVTRFRAALPRAQIFVYDNNSTDDTALQAALAGATVVREPRQGKGSVVRRMFADIDADIYVMADGDGTNPPEDAEMLVNALITERVDMVVAARRDVTKDAGRDGHATGNRIFNMLFIWIFGRDFSDIFSGYRAFSHRFAKTFPAMSNGFEIETEMSVHASRHRLPVCEIVVNYGRRPEGSHSKLSTLGDGSRILWTFAMLMKEMRPLAFYGSTSLLLLLLSVTLTIPVLVEYIGTGQVPRLPTWIASLMLLVVSLVTSIAGVLLDSLARSRAELFRVHYLAQVQRGDRAVTSTVADKK